MAWDDDLIGGMGLEDVLTFGKHKGKTVEQVCNEAPTYLEWALDNNVLWLNKIAAATFKACLEDHLDRKYKDRYPDSDWF